MSRINHSALVQDTLQNPRVGVVSRQYGRDGPVAGLGAADDFISLPLGFDRERWYDGDGSVSIAFSSRVVDVATHCALTICNKAKDEPDRHAKPNLKSSQLLRWN